MSDSGGDGSLGTGTGRIDGHDQPTGTEHSHHIEHHMNDRDQNTHLVVDLYTGTAIFTGVRRADDVANFAGAHDEPDLR